MRPFVENYDQFSSSVLMRNKSLIEDRYARTAHYNMHFSSHFSPHVHQLPRLHLHIIHSWLVHLQSVQFQLNHQITHLYHLVVYILIVPNVTPSIIWKVAFDNKCRVAEDLCWKQGIAFIPIVVESLGGWHKVAQEQFSKLGSALGRHTGQEEGEKVDHLIKRVSILLQKGLSSMLLNQIPGHAAPEVDGFLDFVPTFVILSSVPATILKSTPFQNRNHLERWMIKCLIRIIMPKRLSMKMNPSSPEIFLCNLSCSSLQFHLKIVLKDTIAQVAQLLQLFQCTYTPSLMIAPLSPPHSSRRAPVPPSPPWSLCALSREISWSGSVLERQKFNK